MGLSVRDLVVRYGPAGPGGSTAVDGVSLDVADGEIVALLGPSGCGKSSLLRAVAGLEPVASGQVRFDDADLAGVPVHRRGFGLLFQDGQLFAHRDVARNVAYGLETRRTSRAERDARVRELLAVVGLTGYERRAVATLSGGEKQRVALARSLAPRPRLLLLDEPLSALDRGLRERLAIEVREVLRETRTTAIFVTHDHDEAFTVAHRVAVMLADPTSGGGRLVQVDSPEALWRAPASRRVAEFLGYQAFVPGGGPAGDAWLAVGPAGLRITTEPVQDADVWDAVVVGSVFRRGRTEVAVEADLGTGTQQLAALAGDLADVPEPGDKVTVTLDRSGCAVVPR